MNVELCTLFVADQVIAIRFFVDALGFDLAEDRTVENNGIQVRWVVVRPPEAATGLLLVLAPPRLNDQAATGTSVRHVGFFLRTDGFDVQYQRMLDHGVEFLSPPRDEPYGRVVVFLDSEGNRWDLLGPRPAQPAEASRP